MAGMERFTARARRVLSLAHQEAERMNQERVGTEHLLLGLIQEDGGVASRVLHDLGLEEDRIKEIVERLTEKTSIKPSQIELGPDTQQVLEGAIEEARRMGHHYIGTEHLLLGLVNANNGLSVDVLKKLGVTSEQIRAPNPKSSAGKFLRSCGSSQSNLNRQKGRGESLQIQDTIGGSARS